jgi:NitT/TauT family transport system substrate-binding protein
LSLEDVNIVDLSFPDAIAAMTNGSIDGAWLADPFKTQAIRQGIGVSFGMPQAVGRTVVVTLFSSSFIAQRPDVARSVMVALVRGARDLQGVDAKSDANLASISQYASLPVDTLRGMDLYAFDPDLKPDADTIMDLQQFYMAEGQLGYATPLPIERLVDPSFAEYAADQLGPFSTR